MSTIEGTYIRIIVVVLFTIIASGSAGLSLAKEKPQDKVTENPAVEERTYYTVQPGDHLFGIGRQFGSGFFWESIYIKNAGKITNPHLIFAGQVFVIPYHVAHFREMGLPLYDVLNQPFCTTSELGEIDWDAVDYRFLYMYDEQEIAMLSAMAHAVVSQQMAHRQAGRTSAADGVSLPDDSTTAAEVDDETLEAFREAFEDLVRQEEAERRREQAQVESERQMFVEIDGMIHDDTRSKIGRDFYDIFYANWQSPPEASHYSIRITEQPAPNLGTIIAVEVNNTETFRARLQPRYDFIEEASHFAIRRTYLHLQHSRQQFMIY